MLIMIIKPQELDLSFCANAHYVIVISIPELPDGNTAT